MNLKIRNIDGFEGEGTFHCTKENPYSPHAHYDVPIFHPEAYEDDEGIIFCPVCNVRFDEVKKTH